MENYQTKKKNLSTGKFWGNFKLALFLAFKSIFRGNRWALALIIIVMSFSFVNLVFVSSIINGVMTTMDNQLVDNVFANVVISPKEDEYYIEKEGRLETRINQLDDVIGVAPHLNSSAFVEYGWKDKVSQDDRGKSGDWQVIGIEPSKEVNVTAIHEHIIEGSYLDDNDRDQIVIGVEIAGGDKATSSDFLTLGGVQVGDKVRLTYPNGVQREYTVKGIFQAQEMMRADHFAFVTRKEMASVLDRMVFSERASEILVKARSGVDEHVLIDNLRSVGIGGEIRSWQEYGATMRSTVSTFEIIGGLIGGVGLVVAAAVMFIVIYINVINKKRQIGILRAIGIPQKTIVTSYLFQALFYVIVGIVLGWLLVRFVLQPYFIFNPLDTPFGMVSLIIENTAMGSSITGLFVAGIMAGLIPAWTIMRQSVIKIIWGT
ncbi:ABC transporter permease [Chloroflexota bacterium]